MGSKLIAGGLARTLAVSAGRAIGNTVNIEGAKQAVRGGISSAAALGVLAAKATLCDETDKDQHLANVCAATAELRGHVQMVKKSVDGAVSMARSVTPLVQTFASAVVKKG